MTLIRKQLKPTSALLLRVRDGLGALKSVDKVRLDLEVKTRFEDTLDVG